jgi:hypothetical protein
MFIPTWLIIVLIFANIGFIRTMTSIAAEEAYLNGYEEGLEESPRERSIQEKRLF